MPYSTPTDVTNILNVTFTTTTVPTSTQVIDLISRSDSYIDSLSGHDWYTHPTTEYYDAIGSGPRAGIIVLRHRPLLSVQECAWWQGGIKAWIPGLEGYSELTVGVNVGPSNVLDNFQTTVPSDNLQQPQSFLVYYPEARIKWNTMRLDNTLRYRVIYTYGYSAVPDIVRDLSSCLAAHSILQFWGSQLSLAEDVVTFTKRLETRIHRLETRVMRPGATAGFT